MHIKYQGIFFDEKTMNEIKAFLGDNRLPLYPEDPFHVTYKYRPQEEEYFTKLMVGQGVIVKLVGYGNDGQNCGFEVELPNLFRSHYQGASVPHITVGLAYGAKPKDTRNLDFKKILSMQVHGRFGLITDRNEIIYSYKELLKNGRNE